MNRHRGATAVLFTLMLFFCAGKWNECSAFSFSLLIAQGPASSAILELSGESIKDTLKKILRSNDTKTRDLLMDSLKNQKEEAIVSAWLDMLERIDSHSQKRDIIAYLAHYNDRRITIPVSNYLVHPVQSIRESAAITLKKTGDDRLFPAILRIAGDTNPVHRIYFLEAMNYLYDRRFQSMVIGMTHDQNKSVRIFALGCLYKNKLSESYPLIRNAAQSDPVDDVKISAIEILGNLKDIPSLGIIHQALNSSNREMRSESIKTLIKIRSDSSALPLSSRLSMETDNVVKSLLVEALASIKKVGDLKGLEKIITGDQNANLRTRAAYALGASMDQRSVPLLIKSIHDSEPRVRAEICNSLGNFRTKQSQAALLEICGKDSSLYTRSAALYAIKRMNDRSLAIHLFDLYARESNPMFREMLRTAIREFMEKHL